MNDSLQGGVAANDRCSVVIHLPFAHTDQPEADVERINSFALYDTGKAFKAIEGLSEPCVATTLFWAINASQIQINSLLAGTPFPLGISRAKAVALKSALDHLWQQKFIETDAQGKEMLKFPEPNMPDIPGYELYWLKRALTEFETVFAEEMKEAATYYVPRRGIYWTPALVDTADEAFPLAILGHIPQKTREDWKSAGRCLAFNLLSAAGFHTARAVEGTLEAYYQLFSGKPGKTLKNWNDYIEALKKIATKSTPAPLGKTITELDQMRTDYRNPIMHPRVVLSEPDARMLFANGESLIIAMAQEIAAVRENGGVQLALTEDDTTETFIEYSNKGSGAEADAAHAPAAPQTKLAEQG